MSAANKPSRLSAAEVLKRYTEELLPSFVNAPLTDVNQIGLFGDRPLHVACVRGNLEEIAALIEGGADINSPGELGNTPLHEAVGQGHIEIIRYLLECGADKNARNEMGKAPVDVANLHSQSGISELLR